MHQQTERLGARIFDTFRPPGNYSAAAWKLLRRSPDVFQWIGARLAKLLRGVLEITPRPSFSIHIFPQLFGRGVRGVISKQFRRKVGI